MKIEEILILAAKLPSGLPDKNAPRKLIKEYREFCLAKDKMDVILEAADVYYYAIKSIQLVASLANLTMAELHQVTKIKYEMRSQPGKPKNLKAERQAIINAQRSARISS